MLQEKKTDMKAVNRTSRVRRSVGDILIENLMK